MQNFRSHQKRSFDRGFSRFGKPNFSKPAHGKFSSRPRYSNSQNSRRHNRGEVIDIQRFVKKAVPNTATNHVKIIHNFADFSFSQKINMNLKEIGYETPTPIQDQSIGHVMSGRDILGLANTGTGKTAAFLLPLIDKCFRDKNQKVLIIAPTRELAQQINVEFRKFAKGMGIYSAICVGGVPIYRQISDLRSHPNFVIGTPGRLKDLKDRANINFSFFQNIVLDEIDRMLDMGFVDEIKRILAELPDKRQSLFFSATLPIKIETLVREFLINPVIVKTITGETAANVDQDIVKVHADNKFNRLTDILSKEGSKKVLIFSETKRDVEKLTKNLAESGFRADSIHGDKRQNQRQKALSKFRDDQIQILVATDVAARGLDISNVSHVINYTIPQTYNDYIHRIGRTGRGNNKGFALTFVEAN